MFGRATIRLGIGPHSSCCCYHVHLRAMCCQRFNSNTASQVKLLQITLHLGLSAAADDVKCCPLKHEHLSVVARALFCDRTRSDLGYSGSSSFVSIVNIGSYQLGLLEKLNG